MITHYSYNFPGGTNLRVCLVALQGEGRFEITQTKYRITEEQKQEDGQKLFDFCAECLKTFLDSNRGDGDNLIPPGQKLPLGFTVSILPAFDTTYLLLVVIVLVSLPVSQVRFGSFPVSKVDWIV